MTTRLFNDEDDDVWLSFTDDSCLLIPRRDLSLGNQSPVEAIHWSPSGALVVLEPGFKRVSLAHNCTQSLIGPLKTWQDKRNKVSNNPFVSSTLCNNNGPINDWESTHLPIECTLWPLPSAARHFVTDNGHSVTLKSLDGRAKVTLFKHGLSLSVSILVPVHFPSQEDSKPPKGTFVYSKIKQCFATDTCPESFQYPVQVLLEIINDPTGTQNESILLTRFQVPSNASHVVILTHFLKDAECSLSHSFQSAFQPVLSQLLDPSRPKEVQLMVNRTGIYRVLKDQVKKSVEIQVDLQMDSCEGAGIRVCPDFEFVTLWTPTGTKENENHWESQMYSVKQAPTVARSFDTVFPLKKILSDALKLYQNAHTCFAQSGNTPSHTLKPSMHTYSLQGTEQTSAEPIMAPSSKLLHRVTVPDLADFKCYTDGRIEALFSDRTLLKTQSKVESGLVRVFTPKGEWCTVRLDRAIGFENYVKYVKQFITWVDDQQQQQQSDNGTSNRSRFSATQMQVMEEKRRARDALSQSKRFLESL